MWKKIAIIVVLVVLAMLVSGCYHNYNIKYTEQNILSGQFIILETNIYNGQTHLCYDKNTNIMYYLISNGSGSGIAPYYTSEGRIGIWPDDYPQGE